MSEQTTTHSRPITIAADNLGVQVRNLTNPAGETAAIPVLMLFTSVTVTEIPLDPAGVRGLIDTLTPFAGSPIEVATSIPDLPPANGRPRTR